MNAGGNDDIALLHLNLLVSVWDMLLYCYATTNTHFDCQLHYIVTGLQ